MNNEGVTSMERFSVPLTVDQLATAVHKFVCLSETHKTCVPLRQPRDDSMFIVFSASEKISSQLLPQDGTFMKLAWCQFQNVRQMFHCFPTKFCTKPAVSCAVGHFYGGKSHCR